MTNVHGLISRLEIPVIVAPMFLVSSPELVLAACSEGLLGSFPAHGARTRDDFRDWLERVDRGLAELSASDDGCEVAPYAVNLVAHSSNKRFRGDLEVCVEYQVPVVLSSKGMPTEVVQHVHTYGGVVFHDVASRRHAEKALAAGVDGLILVTQGAGGHTGTINPFALMNEIRAFYDGPIGLAGCISTGRDVMTALAMGADFAYVGTRFIATNESHASEGHKAMVVAGGSPDVFFTSAIDGAPANFLTHSLTAAGIDLDELRMTRPGTIVEATETSRKWKDIWSAGQGIGVIEGVLPAIEVAHRIKDEYHSEVDTFTSGRRRGRIPPASAIRL